MNELLKIFNELKNDSSRNGKEAILKKYENHELFRQVLDFVYNPFIVTGISTKKINKKITIDENNLLPHIPNLLNLMNYLRKNNTGRDIDIFLVQCFIKKYDDKEVKELIKQIVTKNLKVGITAKTINKIYGKNTIPEFSPMLAESFEKRGDKLKGKFYITQKLDGNRCIAIKENGEVKFFTRNGQIIDGMHQLKFEFKNLPDNMVYDGELLLVNKDNLPSDELFRATQKVVRKDGEKKDLEFHIFDLLPVSEFKKGKSKKTYEQRRNTLNLLKESKYIKILPVLYEGHDKEAIGIIMKHAEKNGWEGLMINTANGLYQTKRVSDLLKVKKFKTADLPVVFIEKAIDGQFKGLLARVNVEYKGNIVGVGSGFTIEERRLFAENPDLIVGKIIEVQYFEETKDEKTGKPSLRFPIFKGIREDKTVNDINYD